MSAALVMKLARILVLCALAFATLPLFAADRPPILPKDFAGWHMQGTATVSRNAGVADAANAALVSEYGFTDFESASYVRDDGRTLAIKAARFNDASGAFGAYTFYYQPEMVRERIGDQGCSFNERILFYRGNILVDAVFDKVTAMSAAELRELAGLLPRATGSSSNLPPVLLYMPQRNYLQNTEKYVVGPLGLAQVASPVSADLVDFKAGAEVVLADYKVPGGEATLMVISYPTPQIANEHMRRIDPSHPGAEQQPGVSSIVNAGSFFAKRSGLLLVTASGQLSENDARALLGTVNYSADVTWNENTFFDKRNNLANLLVNIILLCAILIGFALIFGVAFGGLRVALKRIFPGRLFDRPENVEFITLHLGEGPARDQESKLSSSIKAG